MQETLHDDESGKEKQNRANDAVESETERFFSALIDWRDRWAGRGRSASKASGHSSVGSIGLSPIGQGQKGPIPQGIVFVEK